MARPEPHARDVPTSRPAHGRCTSRVMEPTERPELAGELHSSEQRRAGELTTSPGRVVDAGRFLAVLDERRAERP